MGTKLEKFSQDSKIEKYIAIAKLSIDRDNISRSPEKPGSLRVTSILRIVSLSQL